MKQKILRMIDAYWKFDKEQQPISSWNDKQDLLKAIDELIPNGDFTKGCVHEWLNGGTLQGKSVARCLKCGATK